MARPPVASNVKPVVKLCGKRNVRERARHRSCHMGTERHRQIKERKNKIPEDGKEREIQSGTREMHRLSARETKKGINRARQPAEYLKEESTLLLCLR